MTKKKHKLSQDEMIKNLIRDYPIDALEFFNPDVIKKYGKPVWVDFHLQEVKKHSHFDKNLKNDISVIYRFQNGEHIVLSLIEHWSDKAKFDIHRFAHYLIDLDHQFPDYEKIPVALFTDSSNEWEKELQHKIEIKCLEEVFMSFRYRLVRMKSYEAEKYMNTKNKFIAVLRSAMKWSEADKIMLALNFIKSYKNIEPDIKIVIKNIEIIDFFLYLDNIERDNVNHLLVKNREMNMSIVQELKKEGITEGKIAGKLEGKLEDAKNMLIEGLDISLISKITGLSVNEIQELDKNSI